MLESGLLADAGDRYELAGPLPPLAIPATLARLADGAARPPGAGQGGGADRRGDRPRVLATSCSPRSSPLPRPSCDDALDQLVAAELVFRRGTPPEATYIFKHALVQDAAYQSLLKAGASSCTPASPRCSRSASPDTSGRARAARPSPARRPGSPSQAVDYWHGAGRAALERSANLEADRPPDGRGSHCSSRYRETPERNRTEIRPAPRAGCRLDSIRGIRRSRSRDAPTPMRLQMCDRSGRRPEQRFRALRRPVSVSHYARLELRESTNLASRSCRLARNSGDPEHRLAHRVMATVHIALPEHEIARQHLSIGARALYRPQPSSVVCLNYGDDPGLWCRATWPGRAIGSATATAL